MKLQIVFFYLGNWLFFYIRRKYSQFHENLLCAPKSSPLALNVESFVRRWSRDKTPSDKGNESDATSTFYCFLTFLHILLSLNSRPGGGGTPHIKWVGMLVGNFELIP